MPSAIFEIDAAQRTPWSSSSYITIPRAEDLPWFLLDEPHSFVIRVAPISPHGRAIAYAASLQGDDYCELLRAALRDGDDAAARHNLAVVLGALEVAAEQLCGLSPENRVLQ
jgi:hypothetical protein